MPVKRENKYRGQILSISRPCKFTLLFLSVESIPVKVYPPRIQLHPSLPLSLSVYRMA